VKILAIMASPHPKGHCAQLLEAFMRGAGDCESRILYPYEMKTAPCVDCGYCREHDGLCRINDDMARVYELAYWADVIVIASPVYYNSVPAPMKTLMDRCMCLYNRLFIHKSACAKTKKGVLILTAGNSSRGDLTAVRKQLKMLFDEFRADIVCEAYANHLDDGDGDFSEAVKGAEEMGTWLR